MVYPTSRIFSGSNPRSRPLVEQKAELYSILQTAQFLKSRFDRGAVDSNFYIRRMRFFYQQISQLQEELLASGASLLAIVEDFDIEGNLKAMVSAINSTMDYEFNSLAQQWSLDPYQLGAATTAATSDFITLLDYLHIAEDFDPDFVLELLEALTASLSQIHTFKPFADHIAQLTSELPRYFHECYLAPEASPDQVKAAYAQIEGAVGEAFDQFKQYFRIGSNH